MAKELYKLANKLRSQSVTPNVTNEDVLAFAQKLAGKAQSADPMSPNNFYGATDNFAGIDMNAPASQIKPLFGFDQTAAKFKTPDATAVAAPTAPVKEPLVAGTTSDAQGLAGRSFNETYNPGATATAPAPEPVTYRPTPSRSGGSMQPSTAVASLNALLGDTAQPAAQPTHSNTVSAQADPKFLSFLDTAAKSAPGSNNPALDFTANNIFKGFGAESTVAPGSNPEGNPEGIANYQINPETGRRLINQGGL